jgi:fumarylacetoacetase
MVYEINETHAPQLKSWVDAANAPETDFPIQNLPLGVFRRGREERRIGVAIGDCVLDLAGCREEGLLDTEASLAAEFCWPPMLNPLMALGPEAWSSLRRQVSALLRSDHPELRDDRRRVERLVIPMSKVEMLLPANIGDYTDFYASVFHATNAGGMFRPDAPLLPNYKYVPIAYHGRASSIVPSGTPVRRPRGQAEGAGSGPPRFGPSRALDYELEVGCFVGPGNPLGQPIPIAEAETHLFGLCLLNDWSARDIQKWEYQPLGPFLAKSFATSISPWVVTMEALAPYRVPAFPRPGGDPEPLPYLNEPGNNERGGVDLALQLSLSSAQMREQGMPPARLSRSNLQHVYWTFAQMLTHQASNGCNLRPGDLIASGTVSGPEKDTRGCLLELAWRGTEPIELPTGETRAFLQDGDEVILRGWCERAGFARIGLGECRGRVME